MTRLSWDEVTERKYESGVSHGVFYPSNDSGVVWNGLVSVIDSQVGADTEPLYYDGIKYVDYASAKDFKGTIKALSAPDEFLQCIGERSLVPGFSLTSQRKEVFGMTYRTNLNGDEGYKIHILYNLTADADDRSYETITDSPKPTELSWTILGVPIQIVNNFPTMHFIVDSTLFDPDYLEALEVILYGTTGVEPTLPPFEQLQVWLIGGHLIEIIDEGNGKWRATGPDSLITMLDSTTFQITQVDATYLTADKYTITTTDELMGV